MPTYFGYQPNCLLYYTVPLRLKVTQPAAIGDTTLTIFNEGASFTLPVGSFNIGGTQVTTLAESLLGGSATNAIQIEALTSPIPLDAATTSEDPLTGNPISSSIETYVKASLEQVRDDLAIALPGQDLGNIRVSGRLVYPKKTPKYLNYQHIKAKMQITQEHWIEGSFKVDTAIASRFQLDSFFGDYITGIFQPYNNSLTTGG